MLCGWRNNNSASHNSSVPPTWGADDDPDYLGAERLFVDVAEGNGRIPTDNVACFLSRAGYTAIVPGKQDFHFGPERLRQIARFLASRDHSSAFNRGLTRGSRC
jgi:hypothetical protein